MVVESTFKLMLKYILIIFAIILSFFSSNHSNIPDSFSDAHFLENFKVEYNLVENSEYGIVPVFCPGEECREKFISFLSFGKDNISCAFFELSDPKVISFLNNFTLSGGKVKIIVDNRYENKKELRILKSNPNVILRSDKDRKSRYDNYQHNKFCIIDNRFVITGSTNPTLNGFLKNNNNFIFIDSKYIAENYLNEFKQMFEYNRFGQNKLNPVKYNNVTLISQNNTFLISTFFCPENDCEAEVVKYLKMSKNNLSFALFALTNDRISSTILNLSSNVNIFGVIEKRNVNLRGSDFYKLKEILGDKLKTDCNKYNLHDKYFVIDDLYVITGSMNPTKNGVKYNDENVIVIKSKMISENFLNDFIDLFTCNISKVQTQ